MTKLRVDTRQSLHEWIMRLGGVIALLVFVRSRAVLGAIPLNEGSVLSAKSLVQRIPDNTGAQQAYAMAEQWGAARVNLGLGRLALEQGDYQAAMDHLLQARSHSPTGPMISYYLGVAHKGVGSWPEAVDALVAAGAYETLLDWVRTGSELGGMEKEAILQRFIALTEASSPQVVWKAKIELVSYARRAGDCERISQLVWELWESYQRTGYGPSLTYFAQMFYNTGHCFTSDGHVLAGQPFRRARRDYEASLQAIPNYTWLSKSVYAALAQGALEAGEFDDAKAWADRGLTWYPDYALLQKLSQTAEASILEGR